LALVRGGEDEGALPPGSSWFDVYADFSGGDDLRDLQLLRVVVRPENLGAPQSANANYASCGEVAASGGSMRLHIGTGSESNDCILRKMTKDDRVYWSLLLHRSKRSSTLPLRHPSVMP
jgi:hypothetical protein